MDPIRVFSSPEEVMQRALELARRGIGSVEPNPAVGSVIVDDNLKLIGEGYHQQCGGPHAEIHALEMAGEESQGKTIYVTLEPCCHQGKTGPCSQALIRAGIKKVVIAMRDPAPHVDGGGIEELKQAGIEVEVGLLESEALALVRPFVKRVTQNLPWIHAKWAMTLDGKIASRSGHSQWISNQRSRKRVHELRGFMDGIMVGQKTAAADDPLLTVRPPGKRIPARIVVDSQASLAMQSQLVQTVDEAPVIVVAHPSATEGKVYQLEQAGVEVLLIPGSTNEAANQPDLRLCLQELARRDMTNILVEGGGGLLGSFFDQRLIDEVHVFVAPKIIGGAEAVTPIAGTGLGKIPELQNLRDYQIQQLDSDIYVTGRVEYPE
ncbi:MAG: bifunctional diaminohydroxyphosphoribosylaminopyrimidine deaminase/5-amino-6-(5-phosphoribosylamino)uracil reductase RibD [Planctomycetaceae bacterium]|nr:bifunctional diaminohydroxyphosphoribosylaminopyrimidine deaminase/5-amino-6-(5-phosphoribosylamino)uracil reductase RibD [Planctomycetaceae bacterium]MCA9019296.1 bifunctional diaminohydroxyphosphoribosylaminopyrimidine deaminase/5-amino-6-(5-phosphoribosylamino)uracil reductase RibD [Planctomycetaceae bacterium]